METAKRSASRTQERILRVARELFSDRGFKAVSVRDVAEAANVTHPLIHRYFGSKDDLVAAVISNEVALIAAGAGPAPHNIEQSLETVRKSLHYVLEEGRTSVLLLLRSQMDGLSPEQLLEGGSTPVMRGITEVAAAQRDTTGTGLADNRVIAAVVVAAMFGLTAATPWIISGAGLGGTSQEEFHAKAIDFIMSMLENGVMATSVAC